MPSVANTKTLYTPVFFPSSEPPRGSRSTNSVNLKIPSAYLNSLSRTHISLAQIAQEEPSSRPGSPTEDADGSYPDLSTQERVSALRARVREAWLMADANPADGKWVLLTRLLSMGVTSGKAGRWIGTRADLRAPDAPDGGWINATTEAEWAEWEKKVGLKDKVENWKMRLETHEELDSQIIKDTQHTPNVELSSGSEHREEEARTADKRDDAQVATIASIPTPVTVKPADSTTITAQPNLTLKAVAKVTSESAVTTTSGPLKDKSLFGFVVKRSNASAAAVGKKSHEGSKSTNPQPKDAAAARLANIAQPVRKITDIPETSFLPPSFPSPMITSTPNAKPISSEKRKPEPIPFTSSPPLLPIDDPVSSVSSPASSPRVTKVYGQSRQDQLSDKSASLPAIPLAVKVPGPTTPIQNRDGASNNKRQFNPTDGDVAHDHAAKKARTMPSLEGSPVAAGFPRPGSPASALDDENETDFPLPTTPKRQNLPTLTELLASTKKGKKKPHSPKGLKPKSAVSSSIDSSTKPTTKFRFPSPVPPTADLEYDPYMLDPYAINVDHELDVDLDVSPTKSLSSLAGSDSEDENDELNHQAPGLDFSLSSFNPYATSTQHQNHARAGAPVLSSSGFGGYNSQFDIAGQVDQVDKLLEKDVDYEKWSRDPSLERERVRVEASPEESP